jgi:hypothetical protein
MELKDCLNHFAVLCSVGPPHLAPVLDCVYSCCMRREKKTIINIASCPVVRFACSLRCTKKFSFFFCFSKTKNKVSQGLV